MPDNEEDKQLRYKRAVAAAAGAAVGLPFGPVGAVAGAAAGIVLEPLADKVWGEVTGDARRRGVEALEYTRTASSLND
jgi:hypothetical protein